MQRADYQERTFVLWVELVCVIYKKNIDFLSIIIPTPLEPTVRVSIVNNIAATRPNLSQL